MTAYALLEDGRPVLLHLDLGPRESYDAWLGLLQDLSARGVADPLLVIFDLAKLPRVMQAKMKGLVHQVFLAPTYETALKRARALVARFRDRYPAAMDCLQRDLEECVTSLRFPAAHHRRIRTTTRVERLNGEGRRRTKVIPRFPTKQSCLTLLYASLIAASKRWRGVTITPAISRQLQALRDEIAVVPAAQEAVA